MNLNHFLDFDPRFENVDLFSFLNNSTERYKDLLNVKLYVSNYV